MDYPVLKDGAVYCVRHSLAKLTKAVRSWASCRRFPKTCSSAEGPIPGASEGPGQGQGDLFATPHDGEFRTALELFAPRGVIALFQGVGDAVSAGAFFGKDDVGHIFGLADISKRILSRKVAL